MNETFVTEYRQAEAAVNRAIRCPDLAAIALVLVWFRWSTRPDVPLAYHVHYSIRQALGGRDLPGLRSSRDVWDRLTLLQGAGMDDAMDPKPGPDKLAEDEEAYQILLAGLNDRQRQAADLYQAGRKNKEVAQRLGVTQGRATQIRHEVRTRWAELNGE